MFDKLIESEPEGADFHNRRTYFMVSSVVVGVLFLTAVVISIYASDYGLGSNSFELSMVLPPVEMAAVEPEASRPRTTSSQSRDTLPTRQIIMSRPDEPNYVPTNTSSVPTQYRSRPEGLFRIDTEETPGSANGSGRDTGGLGSEGGITSSSQIAENTNVPDPPVIKDPPAIKKPPIQSLGVITGRATYLPKPVYSAAAKAVQAEGKVDVQVMIDESGRVVSASAISGHPLLRRAAEQAAREAVFSPTYLSKVPVKVTGVIVYNFTR
ncbi:MAG: TonB family protein [Acidobacteriota bacterium]